MSDVRIGVLRRDQLSYRRHDLVTFEIAEKDLRTSKAGFRVLRNEVVQAGPITLAGVDDLTAAQFNVIRPLSERKLLEKLPRDRFTLFLKHQPRMEQSSFGLFDLQLSGHTHKGQIFPFTILVRMRFPMLAGDYDLGKGSRLHVSRGTGTWARCARSCTIASSAGLVPGSTGCARLAFSASRSENQ